MALADSGVAPDSFRIEAIDLSAVALERAVAGRYTRNAFRGANLAFRQRHFSSIGADYQISDAMRAQVSFSQGNLLAFDTSAAAGRYDIIFCRNLLIYFDEPTTAAAIAVLHSLLADDGMLLAGYAEVPAFCRNGFAAARLPGAFALHKAQALAAAPARAMPKPRAPAPAAKPATAATPTRDRRPTKATSPPAPAADAGNLLAQARRQADQGNYRAAAASCHAILAADPDSADAYFILGIISECEKKPGVADDYWRRCVYLRPDHYEALCHLALLAEQTGDAQQAAAFRQRAARVYGRRESDARTTR
jgi:chemotaxis protein methyltransferase WspC